MRRPDTGGNADAFSRLTLAEASADVDMGEAGNAGGGRFGGKGGGTETDPFSPTLVALTISLRRECFKGCVECIVWFGGEEAVHFFFWLFFVIFVFVVLGFVLCSEGDGESFVA